MKQKQYKQLRKQYPEYISLDQLYKICKIAKKSARYLIEHGIIPAIDTGQKTWRYKIAIDDVITYLKRREREGSMIPPGVASSRRRYNSSTRKSFSQMVKQGQESEIAEYFNSLYADYEDALTSADIAEMTGLPQSTILRFLKAGHIKSLTNSPRYIIPKIYLLEFVVTRRFIEARTNSELFIKILGGFEIWQTAKSSQ